MNTALIKQYGFDQKHPPGKSGWSWTVTDFGHGYFEVLGVLGDGMAGGKKKVINETFDTPQTYEEFCDFLERYKVKENRPVKQLTDAQKQQNMERSLRRTKKLIREKAIMMGVDRMITCTTRMGVMCPDVFKRIVNRFFRKCRQHINDFCYIAVPERHMSESTTKHKYGSFHLHIATKGFMNYNLLRGFWRNAVMAEVEGAREIDANIDVTRQRGNNVTDSRQRIASYISKYISKTMLDDFEPHKKRYWSSLNAPKPIKIKLYTATAVELQTTFMLIFRDLLGSGIKRVFKPPRNNAAEPLIYWMST